MVSPTGQRNTLMALGSPSTSSANVRNLNPSQSVKRVTSNVLRLVSSDISALSGSPILLSLV